MTFLFKLGEEQNAIYGHFKPAVIHGNQGDGLDFLLALVKQFGCQTDSPIRIVSNRTVLDCDLEQHGNPPGMGRAGPCALPIRIIAHFW